MARDLLKKRRTLMDLKKLTNVAEAASKIMGEALKGDQHKIDVNKNNKIDSEDFKHLRAGKKPSDMKKEETEQVEEGFGDLVKGVKRVVAGKKNPSDVRDAHLARSTFSSNPKVKEKEGRRYDKVDNLLMKKEEIDQVAETILEYESKGGVYRHKGTYGTEKSTEAGYTDYDKENELAKKNLKDKPNRKKYGARQNFVRSTRVNESFSGLLGVYKEGGLKALAEALVKEEPTNDEYTAELEDAKAKAELKKKQPDLAKGDVQAVKQEETEIAVIDADKMNGVQIDTIDEREMTEPEMKKREEIVKSMKKGMAGFKERYGERAKNVMYATATKQAMKD
jgi:hypothetical protein